MNRKVALLMGVALMVAAGVWRWAGAEPYTKGSDRYTPVMVVDANGFSYGGAGSVGTAEKAATDYILSASYRMTITTTPLRLWDPNVVTEGAIPLNVVRIGIVPEGGTTAYIHYATDGNAYASNTTTAQWPSAGVASIPMRHADANKMSVVSSTGTIYATLLIYTPR